MTNQPKLTDHQLAQAILKQFGTEHPLLNDLLKRFTAQSAILAQRKPETRKAGERVVDVTKNGRVDTFTVQGEEELAELKQRMDAIGVYYVVRP